MTIERYLSAKSGQTTTASLYVEDVFSAWLRTGTGASVTISNDIDISTNGGLVITKSRSAATGWRFTDKSRGAAYSIDSSSTSSQANDTTGLTAFTTSGYTIGADTNYNNSGATYVDFAFRKQAKFFDIVTYTGNGGYKTVNHNLGSTPGMIIIKRTDATGAWAVYHRSVGAGYTLYLNNTNASASSNNFQSATSTQFAVYEDGVDTTTNLNGATYVAYLFAHDAGGFGAAGTDSVVACGGFTAASGINQVTLGWEPQFVLIKRTDGANNWQLFDTMRGQSHSVNQYLRPNLSNAEVAGGAFPWATPTPTGFEYDGVNVWGVGSTFIYLAIRRGPMKTPTDATKVFLPSTANGSTTVTTVFPVDLYSFAFKSGGEKFFVDRLRGGTKYLNSTSSAAEATNASPYDVVFDSNTGAMEKYYSSSSQMANWLFRRAPGFFDVVCYTGTGATQNINHNLGAIPELWILKNRTTADTVWRVGGNVFQYPTKNYTALRNDSTVPAIDNIWTTPTTTTFGIGTAYPNEVSWNQSGDKYVAYLFATCPGVSKVGSYTGSGTTKQIDCGFAAGARFVLIKRTDSTSDWYVWDTARGIVSGNDPYLLLNSSAAEVTNTDYIDPYSAGFEISSTAPAAINASGGTYIYLAIA